MEINGGDSWAFGSPESSEEWVLFELDLGFEFELQGMNLGYELIV